MANLVRLTRRSGLVSDARRKAGCLSREASLPERERASEVSGTESLQRLAKEITKMESAASEKPRMHQADEKSDVSNSQQRSQGAMKKTFPARTCTTPFG